MMRYRFLTVVIAAILSVQLRAENITFADAGVKALCVTNWDTDKDLELSFDEAASVSSLGQVFREKSGIVSFDELQYFTGLTAIDDYAFYKSSLQKVTLPATVTAIGQYAFSQSAISGELRVPGTVKNIGNYAYDLCRQMTSIVLEEGVETVGWHCFSGPIKTLSLPASLTYMKSMAVNPYVSTTSSGFVMPEGELTILSHSLQPAPIDVMAFYIVFAEAHLVVPAGSLAAYMAEEGWAHLGRYTEVGDVNRDGRTDIADVAALIAHVTGNTPERFEEHAADINGDGRIDGEDVTLLCSYILG
jgi:hypothetical protein